MANKQTVIAQPSVRRDRVLVESVGDEAVIFDLETRASHALKPLAAAVYAYADGSNSLAKIAELASYRLATQVTEAEVAEVVELLGELELLEAPELQLDGSGISRRDALKAFAAVGAGAALITTVTASAAAAATTGQTGWGNYQYCAMDSGNTPNNLSQSVQVGSNGAPTGTTNNVLIPGVGKWPDGTAVSVPSTNAYDIMPLPGVTQITTVDSGGNTTGTFNLSNPSNPWGFGTANGISYHDTTVVYGQTCQYVAAAQGGNGKYSYSVVNGSWQCVPCDGGEGYQCCSVVCAPASYGYNWSKPESSGAPASPNAPYTGCGYQTVNNSPSSCENPGVPDFQNFSYVGKYCTDNDCSHSGNCKS